jgi:hypothetical protein
MSKLAKARLLKHLPALKKIIRAKGKARKHLLSTAPLALCHCVAECAHNMMAGNVKLSSVQIKRLRKHKNKLQKLVSVKTNKQRKAIMQTGGFLPALLAPLITIGTSLLGGLLNR